MQDASAELAMAVTAPVVNWLKPQLRAGWHNNEPVAPVGSRLRWQDLFPRTVNGGWSYVSRYTWDATAEGWVGEGATSAARVTTPTHDGAGSLQATETMGAGFASLRFNDASGVRDISADGNTLTAWVLVPGDAAGTGWQARIEVQNASFAWQAGPNFSVSPGVWRLISFTPPAGLLANCRAIGFEIGATNVNATQSVYVDTMRQWPEEALPDTTWSSLHPALLDVTPGAAVISNNVVGSTRGAVYDIVQVNGSEYITDFEMLAVFSADVLPTGASYSWSLRFQDLADANYLDLEIEASTAGELTYRVVRKYPSGQFTTVIPENIVPNVAYAPGQKIAARFAGAGGVVSASVWDYLADEPREWVDQQVDTQPTFAGQPRLLTFLFAGNTNGTVNFAYHQFGLTDLALLDDLSEQSGRTYTVSHAMDDGMPSAVSSSVAASAFGSMEADLTGREDMDGRQYFSPFNDSSPVKHLARDLAPVRLDHGVVTANGEERVRVFTGQMVNVPIVGREASLVATSETRMKLRRAVTVPILNGPQQGGEGSWLASYLMYACDVQIMPPPDLRGLQFWAPAHGSLRPSVPFSPEPDMVIIKSQSYPISFREGPFYRAANSYQDRSIGPFLGYTHAPARYRTEGYGKHWLTQSAPRGRAEFWILGADTDPEFVGFEGPYIANFRASNGVSALVDMRINNGRELVFAVDDGTGIVPDLTLHTGLTLPRDGQWHAVGFYYDLSNNEFRARIDGAERLINPSPSIGTSNLATEDDLVHPLRWSAALPWAEAQFYTDVYSDPVDYGWNDRLTRVAGAQNVIEDWEDTTYNVTWSGQWARANDQANTGTWSLKSSAIGNYGISAFTVNVPANSADVQFGLRLSTELNKDYFQLLAPMLYHTFGAVASNGFGTPDIGSAFSVIGTASEYSANGSVGQMSLATVSTERTAYVDVGSADGSMTADLAFGVGSATGDVLRLRLRGRGHGANGNNNVYVQLELATDGNVRAAIQVNENAVTTTIVGSTLLGANGAGSTWRTKLDIWGTNVRATIYNVTTPSTPVVLQGVVKAPTLTGNRWYITGVRTPSNTNATTVTIDNVLINPRVLYEGSGPVNAWHLVTARIPASQTKLVLQYVKDQSGTDGSDAVWVDNLEFRQAPVVTSSFVSQAVVRPIDVDLQAITEQSPREAWGWLSELCQSSLTSMRVNELDVLMLLSPSYFTEPDQLLVNDTITTEFNAQDPDINLDPTKIRNSVQVDFTETIVNTAPSVVLRYRNVLAVPPGIYRYTFPLEVPVVGLKDDFSVVFGTNPPAPPGDNPNMNTIWVNEQDDGSGDYLSSAVFFTSMVSHTVDEVVLQFNNMSGATAYIVNDFEGEVPYFTISGYAVVTNETSVSLSDEQASRRERTLTVQAAMVQTRDNARRLASAILFWTRRPRAELSIVVMGDPRRQPGDRYTLVDPEGTKVVGNWRPLSIEHRRDGGSYTQSIELKEAPPVSEWDDNGSGWDEGLWVD